MGMIESEVTNGRLYTEEYPATKPQTFAEESPRIQNPWECREFLDSETNACDRVPRTDI